MRAVNTVGRGDWSEAISCTTIDAMRPGAVDALSFKLPATYDESINPSSGRIMFKWNEPTDRGDVFGNIMEGRTPEQKADLSRKIVSKLNQLFPEVPIISMNIRDLEKSSYINKTML